MSLSRRREILIFSPTTTTPTYRNSESPSGKNGYRINSQKGSVTIEHLLYPGAMCRCSGYRSSSGSSRWICLSMMVYLLIRQSSREDLKQPDFTLGLG